MTESESAVSAKLDVLIRLLAFSLLEGKRPVEQMGMLSKAGLKPKEIAQMIGTTPHTVSVELSKLRKAKPPGRKGKGGHSDG